VLLDDLVCSDWDSCKNNAFVIFPLIIKEGCGSEQVRERLLKALEKALFPLNPLLLVSTRLDPATFSLQVRYEFTGVEHKKENAKVFTKVRRLKVNFFPALA
jgi:hypothetical protein